MSSNYDINVKIPEKKNGGLSIGIIICIAVAGLIIAAVATFFIIKFLIMKKRIPEPTNKISEEKEIKYNDKSKDLILSNK